MPVKSRRKLVGHQLLYAISVFASLGVFLVGLLAKYALVRFLTLYSLDMIKGM
jgi:hypothetical protein